jgi:exonuclease VII large subunit
VVRHEAGDIIHSALEVSRGSKIQVEMVDGQFPARVEADPQPGDRRRSI